MISGKIKVKVGDKNLGEIDIAKGLSEKEAEKMIIEAILAGEPIIYTKGMTATINFRDYSQSFKVKKTFAFHGFKETRIFVTIPVTLDTLKGLGFITKK